MKLNARAPVFFNPNTDWGPQVQLINLTMQRAVGGPVVALAVGDNDLYTVPANRKAMVMVGTADNTTGAPINVYPTIKVAGTTYRIGTTVSVGATSSTGVTHNFIHEPGDVIGCNAAAIGVNYSITIIEFDSSSPVKTARVLDTINGDSTIYTLPAGKVAYALTNSINTGGGNVNYCGTTGAPNIAIHLVASGGVANAGNQVLATTAVVAVTRSNPSFNGALRTAGETFQVKANGPGAIVFIHVSEWPA